MVVGSVRSGVNPINAKHSHLNEKAGTIASSLLRVFRAMFPLFSRRDFILQSIACAAGGLAAGPAGAQGRADAPVDADRLRLGAAWRVAQQGQAVDYAGILQINWPARQVHIVAAQELPDRAHGLLAEGDGSLLVVATRPGHWLLRLDAEGAVRTRYRLDREQPLRTLAGHALASADGQWIYTTETDTRDGSGWIGVRDGRTLARVAAWPTHGLDPHQHTWGPDGSLLVVNGGIARDTRGNKVRLDTMAPSLVRLDAATGRLREQWRLDDPRLSLRHVAWNHRPDGAPLLGIALQAEHDAPARRRAAPILALWDAPSGLRLASHTGAGDGYSGDICAGPGGGFILSSQRTGEGLLWHPDAPQQWLTLARVTEPCALASGPEPGGVLLAAQLGIARWSPRGGAAMLPWPQALAPDNHWVVLPPPARA